MKMRGAKILVESLKRAGVEVIFGVAGGAVMHITDDLYDEKEIRFINTRHEQGAAHAADGYARATGKVGVAMATSGPGATNLVTGIATAYMDSIPIVAITGQVATHLIGNDAFQEADIVGITRPICKHSFLIKNVNEVSEVVAEAFYIAQTGRPGPVVIDFAKDAQMTETIFQYPEKVQIRGYNPRYEGHPRQIARAVELINSAKRPMVYAGGGIILAEASAELREFVEKTGIPITVTLTGLGAFPETHPLSLKMPGMHGSCYANYAFTETDLVIAIGARFEDRVTGRVDKFAPKATIIHVDIDPCSIGKNVRVDVPVVGDARRVLIEMNKLVPTLAPSKEGRTKKPDIQPWIQQINSWKEKYPFRYTWDNDKIMPQFVIEQIYEATKGEAIIVTDVGQHQMWAAQYYQYTIPRHFLSSGGLGTMGYGMPAAIGAQVGCPDKLVVNINGDGSFMMNVQELVTIAARKLPIKVMIINNGHLGMVRQWQELFFNKRYSVSVLNDNPDFAKVAEAFGVTGIKVTKIDEMRPAIDRALEIDGPVVVDFIVSSEANVYPMVPAGAGLNEMIGGLA
jgi:acetolactate synthase-1/2/3 large subunit